MLLLARLAGRGQHDPALDGRRLAHRRRLLAHKLERALATDSARGGEIEAALVLRVAAQAVAGAYVDRVRREVARGPDLDDVLRSADQSLAGEEAHRQVLVLPRRAHGHRQRLAVDADLERLLDGQLVARALAAARPQLLDGGGGYVRVEGGGHLYLGCRAENCDCSVASRVSHCAPTSAIQPTASASGAGVTV